MGCCQPVVSGCFGTGVFAGNSWPTAELSSLNLLGHARDVRLLDARVTLP